MLDVLFVLCSTAADTCWHSLALLLILVLVLAADPDGRFAWSQAARCRAAPPSFTPPAARGAAVLSLYLHARPHLSSPGQSSCKLLLDAGGPLTLLPSERDPRPVRRAETPLIPSLNTSGGGRAPLTVHAIYIRDISFS